MKLSVIGSSILVISMALTSCGKDEVSANELETAREVAIANSKFNAAKWRGENGHEALNILARGDSTQQPNCPQGDALI